MPDDDRAPGRVRPGPDRIPRPADPAATTPHRARRAVAVLITCVVLLSAPGCYLVGRDREVRWRVPEADHTVSDVDATNRTRPVIDAVMRAIDDLAETSEWEPITVEPSVLNNRCTLRVARAGTLVLPVPMTSGGDSDLHQAVAAGAAPFGYTDVRAERRGGPGVTYVDVADDTMLRVDRDHYSDVRIGVHVPAHHDQCDWRGRS